MLFRSVFDRYLDPSSVEMFARMGVLSKVELEARTEVKWETYTKKIQIEGRVLGDQDFDMEDFDKEGFGGLDEGAADIPYEEDKF